GAYGIGGGVGGAPDAAGGVSRIDHQGREIEGPARDFESLHLRDTLGAAAFVIDCGVFLESRGMRRIDKSDSTWSVRGLGADQNRIHHPISSQARGGFPHARIRAFRKYDVLFLPARPLIEPRHEQLGRFRGGCHLSNSESSRWLAGSETTDATATSITEEFAEGAQSLYVVADGF